jgi:homopolymeric O-antigen transport system ATP-binding protein
MSSEPAIKVSGVSKIYRSYARPFHRLKQAAMGRAYDLSRLIGLPMGEPRYFTEFSALNDVSFEVASGECLGILGRNGAGKSTLLEIIAGAVAPTAGEVWTRGQIGALLELGSGFSGEFTGRENVFLNAALLGLSRREIEQRLPRIEDFAEIGRFIDQPVKTYSSGMVLRLAFAVHVALEPLIMIVDEALAVGDARFQRKCYRRLEEFRRNGGTVLFVTHDMGLVAQICDRALVLEKGELFTEGAPERVIREYHRLLFSNQERSSLSPATDSSRELRYGTAAATISEIFARGVQGRTKGPFRLDAQCDLVLRVQYNAPIGAPLNYGFIISNVQGVEIYGITSSLFNRQLPPGPAGSQFECVLNVTMALTPGSYFLTAALAYADAERESQFLDYRFDALQFEVVGQPRCFSTSAVDLGGEIYERQITETAKSQQ